VPTNDAEYQRQYMRSYRYRGQLKGTVYARNLEQRFVGCDGEGTTLENGYHAYFMLTIGEQTIYPVGDAIRLTSWECLDFITSLDPRNIYVGYFFDYDVAKILEDLPFLKLQRLVNRSMRTGLDGRLFPVDYGDFQLDYLPHKEFKVRRRLSYEDGESVWSPWIEINDVGSFFQCTFVKAIEDWTIGSEENRADIRQGKEGRATFRIDDTDEISRYNALEIDLLETLMGRFRDACMDAGYVPRKWQGPGLLAEAMLRAHGVRRSKDTQLLQNDTYSGLLRFATNAYYGGRTEVAAIGPVNRPVFQHDINAAYPHAMRVVPCLEHGIWRRYEGVCDESFDTPTGKKGESFALQHGSFTLGSDSIRPVWYGLPVRTSTGTIVFPERGSGWYWSFEIGSAVHQSFQSTEGWIYTRTCQCTPLAFVEQIYAERERIGKNGPGIVLKLGSNSIYGKTVQSIGQPTYANPIWGSFLTAFPRMMLQQFQHSSPLCKEGKCGWDIMVATDSVTTTSNRKDYPESRDLGGWSREVHPKGIFIVQPGVYFGTSGKPSKTRGVPRTVVDKYEAVFRDAFDTMVDTGEMQDGDVTVPQTVFVGIRYAVHRRDMKLLGQWIEFGELGKRGKVISFDWTSKRAPYPVLAPNETRTYLQTFPYEGSPAIHTLPYAKDIGGLRAREESRMAFELQPDWAGVTYE